MKVIHSPILAVSLVTAVLVSVSCGTAETSKNNGKDTENEGKLVQVSDDSVQFEISAPSDNQNAQAALTDMEAPGYEPSEPMPMPVPTPEPGPVPSNRIVIRCKGDVGKPKKMAADESMPVSGSRFVIGLETISGETASYESVEFYYSCGTSGAIVTINNLVQDASYAVDAQYWQGELLTHKGKTDQFTLGKDGTASVKLLMSRVEAKKKGKAKVDVIFADEEQPAICPMEDIACTDVYQPVICTGTASPLDGREIPLLLGPVKGSNQCEAKKELLHLACLEKTKLINIDCKPAK
jgi:hypothetical protein